MKVLYFDCFSGISGDMTIGALLDLGIDEGEFRTELKKLKLSGYDLIISKKVQKGITGTDVRVVVYDNQNENKHSHEHAHNEQDHHNHEHTARNLHDIINLIEESDLKRNVKDMTVRIFTEIAKAEAKVHNKSMYDIHFHEVGAVDSIVDITGVAVCIDLLEIEKVFSSPLHAGKGFIHCQHGRLPVPVPAVMEIISQSKIPVITEDISTEIITPTGAGIIKCLASDFGNMPAMIIDRTGYGMGKRETGGLNALRVSMGTLFENNEFKEEITVLETNMDDISSEVLGYTMEQLFENGAVEVFYTPVYMKKNRPGVMLTVLTDKDNEDNIADIILKETSTLGIRSSITKRYCMDREIVNIKTSQGNVRVKVSSKGDLKKVVPEYEDCRYLAKNTGKPLHKVFEEIRTKYIEAYEGQ